MPSPTSPTDSHGRAPDASEPVEHAPTYSPRDHFKRGDETPRLDSGNVLPVAKEGDTGTSDNAEQQHTDVSPTKEPTHEPAGGPDDNYVEPVPEAYDASSKWWALKIDDVCSLVQLEDSGNGIDADDASRRATELGNNIIPISGGPSILWLFVSQFLNSITLVLTIVAVISIVFKDYAEFGVVLFILLFNGFLGFYQEYGAAKSLQSLKEMTAGSAKVIRSGVIEVIFIDEVVIGDVIILEQGTSVSADCRIIEASNLEIDEALLTGEALPVLKHVFPIPDPEDSLALGDRKNMAYRNTLVTQGRGRAIVVAGGLFTEMGKLAKRLDDGGGEEKTQLMKTLDYMMYFLFFCCLILAVIVFAANKFKYDPTTLSYATAVAIAILPESMVVVVTVAMTIAVRRMANQKCIVRKLSVLEVLGNVTDICSDKTGTLTENKMVVKKAVIGVEEVFSITGSPYSVHGYFHPEGHESEQPQLISSLLDSNQHYYDYFMCAATCGSTVLHKTEEDPDTLSGHGNPTEVAIQVMTWKAQMNRERLQGEGWDCIAEYPFDSKIKRMSSAWFNETSDQLYLCTKGAPERIVSLCNFKLTAKGEVVELTNEDRERIDQHIRDLASQGLRTICFAQRNMDGVSFPLPTEDTFVNTYHREIIEMDLIYLGIVGIYDPPRPESLPSVVACQHAGIMVRMLTGDHTSTAGSIAAMLNIIAKRDVDNSDKLLAGPDFDKIDPDDVDKWDDLPLVIGRCSPESKVKMIESLHRRKRVVAMTGDGFNDSPSIKIADIGCAMGSGTDVTKGVADLVITDDNFATIVKAVAEGRRVSQCVKKFVLHLLTSNVAEVIALICGLPIRHEGVAVFVLSPLEILWLNLVTSGPPATGLSLDAATSDILLVPPNRAGLFTVELLCDTFYYGIVLGALCLCSFVFVLYGIYGGPSGTNCNSHRGENCTYIWKSRATAYGVLYFGILLHAYNVRHSRMSVFKMKWLDNIWLVGSFGLGTILFFLSVYIPPVAKAVFVHTLITWELGVIAVDMIIFMAAVEIYKVLKNVFFPLKLVDLTAKEEEMQEQEYMQFTQATWDNRDAQSVAQENLRMSFASYADSVGTAHTANRNKKKGKKH